MKKLLLILTLILGSSITYAQNQAKIENIPPFKILKPDSTYFTPANLKKNKPVVIIYFSPDCSHCQHLMYELRPKMKQVQNAQIVMITFTDFNRLAMIRNFYRDFYLSNYPNITVGTEGRTYLVQKYYQVVTTPYVAVYDKKGKLAKAFPKSPSVDELIAAVKKAS